MEGTVTVVDPCTYCGRSTAFGSPDMLFVNRIPVDDGWGCRECTGYECDECGGNILLDEEVRVDEKEPNRGWSNYHVKCYDPNKHGDADYGHE